MINAIAIEIATEAGTVDPLELLHAKKAEASARGKYALAVEQERRAIRIAEERSVVDCPSCMHCRVADVIVQSILCVKHMGELHAIRTATARRITAQRVLADAAYQVERIRKGQR